MFEIGDRNLISRSATIERGETITLFDVNIDIQQGWQLVFQLSGDSQQGEIEIETFTNISSIPRRYYFGTKGLTFTKWCIHYRR